MAEEVVETEQAEKELSEEMRRRRSRVMMPGGCRAYMRKRLAKEFEGIVNGFVEAAKTGSCPHVKLATELMKPSRKSPAVSKKKGSTARLFEKMEKERAEKAAKKQDAEPRAANLGR